MRPAVLLATLLVAARANADVVYAPPVPPDPDRGVFWRDLIEPNRTAVQRIVMNAQRGFAAIDSQQFGYYDASPDYTTKIYRELYGMLRYARRLAPENTQVLGMLGRAADGIGKTREALEALHMAVSLVGPDKAGIDITSRLGSIYLRMGKLDEAIRYLRAAQGPLLPGVPATAQTLVHLAHALALRGQMSEAIDVLANSLPNVLPGYYPNEYSLVSFALAVQYDRDEQRGAAFDVIDRMETAMQSQQQLASALQLALANIRFAPPEDEHYYLALAYEVGGYYAEARAEWALYAADDKAPWRGRALDHIAAIDGQRRSPLPANPARLLFRRRVGP